MQNIIKDGLVFADDWQVLRPDAAGLLPEVDASAAVIVPWAHWRLEVESWRQRRSPVAVWLAPSDEPLELLPYLNLFTLVAIDFPSFTDGRGYSLARLLRERYNYAGELRALGDVWQDQLQALWQVGFDSFEIKQGKPLEASVRGLGSFSEHYQSNARQPLPLFRRSIT